MTDEDGTGRFFRSFANAMLERSLPAIREWLESRLGPGSQVGSVALDEGRVIVKDAHVPIGARLWLDVDEAILDATPEDLMAGLPPARLRSLVGAIRAVQGTVTTFEAPVEVDGRGGASTAWVDGELRLGGATWKLERGLGAAMPMYGTARIRVTADGWSLEEGSLTSGASSTRLAASGSLRASGRRLTEGTVQMEYARLGHALDVISAFRGDELRLPLPFPLDACVDGTLTLDAEGTLHADLSAQTERSDIALRFESKDRVVRSLELEGSVAPSEIFPETFDTFFDRHQSEAWSVDASGRGPFEAPVGRIELSCAALETRWTKARHAARASLVLDGSKYALTIDLDGAGHATGELSVAPYGSIDGAATLSLVPEAWRVASTDASGTSIDVEARIGGTRSLPDIAFDLRASELGIQRGGGEPVVVKRCVAEGALAIEGGRARLTRGHLEARVGPGSVELWAKDALRVKAARVDAEAALNAIGLFVDQSLVGVSAERARFVIPDGSQIWADIEIEGRRVNGTAHVHAARSCLSFAPLRIEGGSFAGTEARATLSSEDAIAIGLFLGSPILPGRGATAELTASVVGAGAATRLSAHAQAPRVGVRLGEGRELLELGDVELDLEISRGALEVRSLTGLLYGGRLEAAGAIRRAGAGREVILERLRLRGVGKGLRERFLGARIGDAWRGLSIDLDLSGDLSGLTGEASFSSEHSELAATIATSGRAFLDGTGLRARIDPRDVAPWLGPVAIHGDPFSVNAQIGGTWESPAAVLTVTGGAQRVSMAKVVVPIESARLEATIERDSARWTTLSANVAGGVVSSHGLYDRGFGGVIARLCIEGVTLHAIEGVADELAGTLHVDAALFQRAGKRPGARIVARVEQPRYEALRRLAAIFSRYGLRHPERRGTEPLTLTLRAGDGELEIRDVEANIDEVMSFTGRVVRTDLGSWRGEGNVTAKKAWLQTSHLFIRPAEWLGDVVVPIRVEGRDGSVRVRADVLAALDGILAKTGVGRGLQGAIDKLLHDVLDMAPTSAAPRHHGSVPLTGSDALIDRIAQDAPEADAAIGALLERGFAPGEIADRVRRRRP